MRSLVIHDFAPDPFEFPNIWGKLYFLFYQCTKKISIYLFPIFKINKMDNLYISLQCSLFNFCINHGLCIRKNLKTLWKKCSQMIMRKYLQWRNQFSLTLRCDSRWRATYWEDPRQGPQKQEVRGGPWRAALLPRPRDGGPPGRLDPRIRVAWCAAAGPGIPGSNPTCLLRFLA